MLVFLLSGSQFCTMCPMCETAVSYTLPCFLLLFGGRVIMGLAIPPLPEADVKVDIALRHCVIGTKIDN